MTLRTVLLARQHDDVLDGHLSAAARLMLIALADSADDDGAIRDPDPTQAMLWGLRSSEMFTGWDELVDRTLLVIDPSRYGAPAVGWLTIVPGWLDAWQERLWQAEGVRRQSVPTTLRRAVLGRDDYTCRSRGARQALVIDHVHPQSRGGLTALWNLQTLRQRCNGRKSNRVAVTA